MLYVQEILNPSNPMTKNLGWALHCYHACVSSWDTVDDHGTWIGVEDWCSIADHKLNDIQSTLNNISELNNISKHMMEDIMKNQQVPQK